MNLYVIRHAIAHTRDPERWPDDSKRPLTALGRYRFERVASELGGFAPPPHTLLSSPFVRAVETAQILQEKAGWPEPEIFAPLAAEMSPEATSDALLNILREKPEGRVAVVGHRPNLHELAAYLLTGRTDGISIKIKKGGGLYLSFPDGLVPGAAELRWHTTPKMSLPKDAPEDVGG